MYKMASVRESSGITNSSSQQFMNSPLVTWVKTFRENEEENLEYKQLSDGVFLYDVMLQIDPSPPNRGIIRPADDVTSRTRNFDILVKNLRSFYQENLGQLILLKSPNVVQIGAEPDAENSVEDLQMVLLLILGCAVQCNKKEQFVENIKQLNYDIQHSIVCYIQQITDNPESVWTDEWNDMSHLSNEQLHNFYKYLVQHLKRIIHERDSISDHLTELVMLQEPNYSNNQTNLSSPSMNGAISDKHHLGVELADSKARLRKARQELEEKTESVIELRDELDQCKCTMNKLRQENLELVQEARAAKAYRDEIDVLKERAAKVDKLESEIQRYKDRMNEMEFYKSRVDELREDNRILVETKEMLEDQLESSRKRAEQVLELENDILRYKARLNELMLEKDADKEKITELIEDNTQLELDKKSSMNESAILQAELRNIKSQNNSMMETSLSEQFNENAQGKVLKLELEIQRLQSTLENYKESSFHGSSEKILELEKENKRLSLKMDQLQETHQKQTHNLLELEEEHEKCSHETAKLQNVIEAQRTSSQRQQNELQLEKQQLSEIIDTLRERNKKSENARLLDIETENKKLMEQYQTSKSQLSKVEFENHQLNKTVDRLRGDSEELLDVQMQKEELEKENSELKQSVATLRNSCEKQDKMEMKYNEIEKDNSKLKKSLDSLKNKYGKMEKINQENTFLLGENQKLNKALDTLKNSARQLLDLEHEKEELSNQNKTLEKNLEVLRLNCAKLELIEVDMMSVSNENQRLQKTIETCHKKNDDLGHENQELDSENRKLQKTVETLKVSTRRYNDLERDITEMEANNDKLLRENKSLEKESARLKQAMEIKDSTIDDVSSRISTLGRENKWLQKELESNIQATQRLKDLEKDNKELIQQLTVDKKTLVTLREELVNEKIKTQQLQNELEKLNSDLQRIGINKEKLINAEQEADQTRFKMLENLLEDTLKNSLEIKDEKIAGLESRLKESIERTSELKNQLEKVTSQCESYKIKCDEMSQENISKNVSEPNSSLMNEVLSLKDQIVDLEKANTSLKEEKKSLQEHSSSWKDQASGLQSQIMNLQHHCSNIGQQNTQFQSKLAKLQVENTTLQSENQSLVSQISVVQSQSAALETERDYLKGLKSKLQAAQESLLTDHEALQKIHEQLSSDYENLISEFASFKNLNKNLKLENKAFKEKLQAVLLTQDEVMKIKQSLEEEKVNFRSDCKSLINLRTEHHRLKEDFRALHGNCERIRTEYKNLQEEYKSLKTENNSFKLKNTELQGDLADNKAQTNALDIQVSKLNSKCELLMQMNSTLEDDRKSLMTQLSSLLTQYHDLLTQTLTDKEVHHEEEKMFADRVNNLRRQKEMLEQKIMDQYRQMENSPKRRGFGANLVKRVRKAGTELISRVPRTGRSRERGQPNGDSHENTDSTDNSSATDGTGSENGTTRNSPDSVDLLDLTNDFSRMRQNSRGKDLTSFYSVMNMRKSLPPNSEIFEQHEKIHRGSFSSEDIKSILTDSHSSDGHQGDEESPTPSLKSNDNKVTDSKSSDKLSLPGSRKAVYYTSVDKLNHDDNIPTRDVGPGISRAIPAKTSERIAQCLKNTAKSSTNLNKSSIMSSKSDFLLNGRNSPDGNSNSNPHQEMKSNNLLSNGVLSHQCSSLINIPIASSTPTKSPMPLPRKNSNATLNSSQRKSLPHVNAERKDSNSSGNSSETPKSWRSIDTKSPTPKPTTMENSKNSSLTSSNARRSSKHQAIIGSEPSSNLNPVKPNSENPPLNKDQTSNNLSVLNTSSKSDNKTESSKSDNAESKEKRTDNSIWYEYGCV